MPGHELSGEWRPSYVAEGPTANSSRQSNPVALNSGEEIDPVPEGAGIRCTGTERSICPTGRVGSEPFSRLTLRDAGPGGNRPCPAPVSSRRFAIPVEVLRHVEETESEISSVFLHHVGRSKISTFAMIFFNTGILYAKPASEAPSSPNRYFAISHFPSHNCLSPGYNSLEDLTLGRAINSGGGCAMAMHFKPGDFVVYRKQKHSVH